MFRIDTSTFLVGALAVLVLPMKWILSAAAAALFHEFCHILVIWILDGRVISVRVSPWGCSIVTGNIPEWQQVCSILAGPLGSLSLLLLRRRLPLIALCGLLQGMYNLLPVLPLDGGRLLRLGLCRICPTYMDVILKAAGILTKLAVFLSMLSVLFRK